MAWNEPDNDNRNNDPWGSGSGNKGGDQGPPDLDEVFSSFLKKLNGMFGDSKSGHGGGNAGGDNLSKGLIAGILVIVALIWVFLGFYTVDEQQRGVVLRFGKALDGVVPPGLHWNPPLVDDVEKVNVTRVNAVDIGGTMLTVDDNIVDLNMSVQYIVTNAREYYLNVRDPVISLQHAAESAIRHVVGSTEMTTALTTGRDQIAQEVQARLQSYLDMYGTGMTVSQVNIDRSQPPGEVRAAFDDVIKADEDNRSIQNQARAYASQIVPEARGLARRIVEEAEAYREQVIARAQGDAQRFDQLLVEYQKAPEVTRNRMYLDAIEDVMSSSSKVLIDVEGGNNMLYLPLDKIMEQNQSARGTTSVQSVNQSDIRAITDEVIRTLQARQGTITRGSR